MEAFKVILNYLNSNNLKLLFIVLNTLVFKTELYNLKIGRLVS